MCATEDGSHKMPKLRIRPYTPLDSDLLFDFIECEGAEWEYCHGDNWAEYEKILCKSATFLFFEDSTLIGYICCCVNKEHGVYIHDLLIAKAHHGNDYGRLMVERVGYELPDDDAYVIEDDVGESYGGRFQSSD